MAAVERSAIVIQGNRCLVPRELFVGDMFYKMKEELTGSYKLYGGRTMEYKHYYIDDDVVWLPRNYGYKMFKGIADIEVNMTEGVSIDPSKFTERYYRLTRLQEQFGRLMMKTCFHPDDVRAGGGGCVAVLPCGVGKSYLAIAMIRKIKKKTLYITNMDISVRRMAKLIHQSLPLLNVQTFETVSTLEELVECDVLISTVHRFILKYSRFRRHAQIATEFAERVGLVIYDEIHTLAGRRYSDIFDLFSPLYQLGLTATYERRDTLESVYTTTIGPPCILEGIAPPKFPTIVHIVKHYNRETDVHRAWRFSDDARQRLDIVATIKNLTSDPMRFSILKTLLIECLRRDEDTLDEDHPVTFGIGASILIFCNYREEIDNVYHYITNLPANEEVSEADKDLFDGIVVERVTGRTTDLGVGNAISNARIIISSYKKLSTAFSETRFTTAILWSTAKRVITQAVGRIGRYCDTHEEWNSRQRHIYDIVDGRGTLSYVQHRHRRSVYDTLEFETEEVEVVL